MNCATKPIPWEGLVYCADGKTGFNAELFLSVYDEFSELKPDRVAQQGTISVAVLSEPAFGRFYQLAVALLTAHRLALTYNLTAGYETSGKNALGTSAIGTNLSASSSSLTEGATALGLVTSTDDPFIADLARTAYGLELLALIKAVIPAGEIVHGAPIHGNYTSLYYPVGG